MKLHLGCGAIILEGWTNVDIDGDARVQKHDLRLPLPFATDSADFVFHEHFLEHLTLDEGLRLLAECYRVLKPGGVMRVVTPDMMKLTRLYLSGEVMKIPGVWEPKTKAQMLNEGMRLWGHQFLYDAPELFEAIGGAGFQNIRACGYKKSSYAELVEIDQRPHYGELIMEATK